MIKAGIEQIHFSTGSYVLDLRELAADLGVDPQKYAVGLGQEMMSVASVDEDVVTLAARAAQPIVAMYPQGVIRTLLFATETGIDQSKAAGLYVHRLLGMHPACRIVEMKQACYSATAAIQLATSHVNTHPNEKVLVIAADIARYEPRSNAEPTQGCGAIAILIGNEPNIAIIDPEHGIYTEEVMDFWRPNYSNTALVDGKYSAKVYIQALKACWRDLISRFGMTFDHFQRFCYHLPFTRMASKAHLQVIQEMASGSNVDQEMAKLEKGFCYSRQIGNCYSASAYIGLVSLLECSEQDLSDDKVAIFSYGSGCVSEILSATIQKGYKGFLRPEQHQKQIQERKKIDIATFRQWQIHPFPTDGSNIDIPKMTTGKYRLKGIYEHKRLYEPC